MTPITARGVHLIIHVPKALAVLAGQALGSSSASMLPTVVEASTEIMPSSFV
jgi:hypothetical protein